MKMQNGTFFNSFQCQSFTKKKKKSKYTKNAACKYFSANTKSNGII